jgi:hypothetical protein
MDPFKKISDEDFIHSYESKRPKSSRIDKYVTDPESEPKSFNYVWWIIFLVVFLVAYLLFSKYLFPPKI